MKWTEIDHSQTASEGGQTATVDDDTSNNDPNANTNFGHSMPVVSLSLALQSMCTVRSYLETSCCGFYKHFYKLLDPVYKTGENSRQSTGRSKTSFIDNS